MPAVIANQSNHVSMDAYCNELYMANALQLYIIMAQAKSKPHRHVIMPAMIGAMLLFRIIV
eukprot:scaffold180945_cov45-Prasinocladus_malaysianus.AAC.2